MSIRTVFIWFYFLVLSFLAGCSDPEIDWLEDERGIFSIYGAIDIEKSPNYIRIKDLRTPLSAATSSLNAIVEFQDLETGATTVLRDTIIEFNLNRTNNFILHEDLEPRRSYQLTVTRPDGNSVSSIATTPGITRHSVSPNENVECGIPVQMEFQNVLPSEQIRLEVTIPYEGGRTHEVTRFCSMEREGNTATLTISTIDLLGIVFPAPGTNQITCRSTPSEISCNDLVSEKIHLRYLHLGPEWQRVYPLYPNDPEDIRDVKNGLGFFGGYREKTTAYTVRNTPLN